MQKSIVTKYFSICSVVVLACVLCIGSILLLITSQFYRTENKEALLAGANEVITATRLCYLAQDNTLDDRKLEQALGAVELSSGMHFAVLASGGEIVGQTGGTSGLQKRKPLSDYRMRQLENTGYFEVGNLDDAFAEDQFVLALPSEAGGQGFYVLGWSSAQPLKDFMGGLSRTFFITAAVVMTLVLFILYFAIRNLLEPVRKMTEAARRFGRGDFSERLEITDDELGLLASTMNEMAYSLSMTEESRKSFIANVSHELKTPMTTIGGFVDGVLDGTIPQEQHRHYLTVVSQEVARLSRLVRSMLNISKYEAGEMALQKERVDVAALTVKTVLLFEQRIEEKKLDIRGLGTRPCFVYADVDLIQQILYNLVENAVKFVNEGGFISFAFRSDETGTTVSIRNSGEGLSPADLPKVFDRFYKTDESHGRDVSGVGLGLAIVRSIINLHGGEVLVRSAQGEYTEFSFTLSREEKPS